MTDATINETEVVTRRAPINPFERLRSKKGRAVNDPKLKNNPLYGRLIVCSVTTAAIIFVFLAELVFNKVTFNGRCISKVLYPRPLNGKVKPPYLVELGYGACEYNLQTRAADRVFFGTDASDKGWPIEPSGASKAAWDSPNFRIFESVGGLSANLIRNYGEWFRLVWSMFLHGGWMHIAFNVCSQVQILWIVEPDWGFWRTFILFFISGIGGNLMSAVLDPCGVTVGSSGALYGLYGALIPYCIEYWNTLPHPIFIIIFLIVSIFVGLLTGLSGYIDNYAHLGGCMFGLLWGFTTIRSVSIFDRCAIYEKCLLSPVFSWMLTKKYKAKLELSIVLKKKHLCRRREELEARKKAVKNGLTAKYIAKIKKSLDSEGSPPFKMRLREWVVRCTCGIVMVLILIILSTLLFNSRLYSKFRPWGQLKLRGWHSCHCCFVKKLKIFANADTAKDIFWCWNDKRDAQEYCRDTDKGVGLIESSANVALNLVEDLGNAFA
ncbi:hypothetical protein BEWA_023690 [Theileria equi strain WA]|uniref:Rhomboid-like protease n=1 Tax=Theileria equi strain WA TaxID=1537102 RepID=L0AVF0_THEEQ|nr:hypothetical protein BEWA_023690 [Theileria equi strain WA]AFZ79520.1 hypothetical protein BEWA_023690 [Theileria equi strain WA]|eukprot:XP_004829186.1 hypothetical protein BEWA_023690 [Theileria equi strain WA]